MLALEMDLHQAMESGAGMNQGYGGMQQSSGPPAEDHQQMNVARNLLEELKAERNSLDPSFVHCIRWLDQGLSAVRAFLLGLVSHQPHRETR